MICEKDKIKHLISKQSSSPELRTWWNVWIKNNKVVIFETKGGLNHKKDMGMTFKEMESKRDYYGIYLEMNQAEINALLSSNYNTFVEYRAN